MPHNQLEILLKDQQLCEKRPKMMKKFINF